MAHGLSSGTLAIPSDTVNKFLTWDGAQNRLECVSGAEQDNANILDSKKVIGGQGALPPDNCTL